MLAHLERRQIHGHVSDADEQMRAMRDKEARVAEGARQLKGEKAEVHQMLQMCEAAQARLAPLWYHNIAVLLIRSLPPRP